jgi:hypothetical protein
VANSYKVKNVPTPLYGSGIVVMPEAGLVAAPLNGATLAFATGDIT